MVGRLLAEHFMIIALAAETPDMDKENHMKSTMAQKDLWWLVATCTYQPLFYGAACSLFPNNLVP